MRTVTGNWGKMENDSEHFQQGFSKQQEHNDKYES